MWTKRPDGAFIRRLCITNSVNLLLHHFSFCLFHTDKEKRNRKEKRTEKKRKEKKHTIVNMAVWFGMLFLRFLFVSFRYVHRTRGTFFSSLLCAVGICTLCGCVLSAIYQWWNLLSHALPSYIFVYVACEKSRLAFRSSRAFPQIPKIHIYIAHFFVHIILAIRPYVRVCMMWHMLGYLYDYI